MLDLALLVAIVILVFSQIADVITTRRALSLPGTKEGNPFVRTLQKHMGDLWWIGKCLPSIAVTGAAFAIGGAWAAIIVAVIASAMTLYAAYHNAKLYEKLSR